jgi:tetratricopeptide (TPR) repeat protein
MHRPFVALGTALALFVAINSPFAQASDTNLPAPSAAQQADTNSQEMLRVYLQLQEQLHSTQLAIEQNRREAKEVAEQNAEILANRLHAVEAALAAQRARELDAMQSSNRVLLIVAGTFATFGFLVMLVIAYFQWRTVHGLAQVAPVLPEARALPASEVPLLSIGPAEPPNNKLLGALERLEKRIHELELTPHESLHEGASSPINVSGAPAVVEVTQSNGDSSNGEETLASSRSVRVQMLLGKGLSMLNLDKPAEALNCFDEVLKSDPKNSEALVRRGLALERLQLLNEAIESYDRAIALNDSMTIAYLHKGGLFNRMERFDEALACYEQALRTQERKSE